MNDTELLWLKSEISRQIRSLEENGFGYMSYLRTALFDPSSQIDWDKVADAFKQSNPDL